MSDRVARAVRIGMSVTFAINLRLIIGAPLGGAYVVFVQGQDAGRVLRFLSAAIALSLAFWFILPFTLAVAFPPPGDRVEFPDAGKFIWPLMALLTIGTVILVALKPGTLEDKDTEGRRIEAARYAIVERQIDKAIEHVRQRCAESPEEFRRLVLLPEHGAFKVRDHFWPSPEFLRSLQSASARHDPSQPCTGLMDAIVQAGKGTRRTTGGP